MVQYTLRSPVNGRGWGGGGGGGGSNKQGSWKFVSNIIGGVVGMSGGSENG